MNKLLAGLLAAQLFAAPAFADSTINGLGAGAAVQSTDIFPAYQGANPATGVTAAQIKTFAGGVSSVTGSCGVAVSPTTGAAIASANVTARNNTATTDTLVTGDCGTVVTENNASPVAVAIAQAGTTGFATGYYVTVKNKGAGVVTITPTTSTIDGSATLTLAQNASVDIYSDGTNYITLPGRSTGGGTPGGSSGQLQINNGSGGFGAVAAPSGTVVGTTDTQTLSNKSIAASEVNSGTLPTAQMPALTGDCTTSAGAVATSCNGFLEHPGYIASNWYAPMPMATMTTGSTFTANQIYCRYHQFPVTVTFTNVAINVTTGGGGNAQIALYTSVSHLPGALISNTASISTTTTGGKTAALGSSIQIGPGGTSSGRDIWICINSDNATHVLTAYSSSSATASEFMGSSGLGNVIANAGNTGLDNVSCSGANCNGGSSTYGTWPTLTGSTWTSNVTVSRFPVVPFQVTSSP